MRLKSLELQGFKSFPDRTKMNFDAGMTVVIGPNGSGKSNIADAIRWVLGELSSKNIRGTKMEDVIFGGTDNRRPMGYAEVSLTFDNREGENILPLEYDEVTITRKYYRSGDSEYLINGQKVRLRDITELFMNTGLGKSGYSIIGQGRIAEIISKKSEDRRGIFEEAAGIAKYRYRKSEAERKLEKTDDNLARVTDILSEIEGRVGPLEKEAEKAKKYLELYEEKKQVDVSLWLYEIDSIHTRSKKLQENYEITSHELDMANDSLAGLERQTELLLQRMRENNEKSESARKEAGELSEKKHEADAQVLLCEKDLQHLEEERIRLDAEITAREKDGQTAVLRLGELAEQKKDEEERLTALAGALSELDGRINRIREEISAHGEKEEKASANTESAREALQRLLLELSTLEGSKTSEDERRKELEERIAEASAKIQKTGEELLRSERTLTDYKQRIASLKEEIEKLDKAIAGENGALQKKKEECDALTVKRDTVRERVKLLQKMEEHFEGYAGSVRYVMSKAGEGALSGICGPVSKLIKVDEKYAAAIEVALGPALQHIVTEDEPSAKAAIEELKRSGSGRATFYPLSNMTPQKLDIDYKKLEKAPGFLGLASDLADCGKAYRPVVDYLLCRTVICKTLDHASDIAKAFSYKFKVVSLDGQVVNPGGSLTGGSLKKEAGILTRSAEIGRLQKEDEKLTAEIEKLEKELTSGKKKLTELDAEKDRQNSTLEIVSVMFTSEDTEYKVRSASLESDKGQLSALREGMEALRQQMDSFDAQKATLEEAIKKAEEQVEARKNEEDETQKQRTELERARDAEIEKKNALLLEKSSLEKDRAATALENERVLQHIEELKNANAEGEESKNKIARKKEECRQKIEDGKDRSSKISLRLKVLEDEDAGIRAETMEFETRSNEIREQQKEKTRHKEIIFKEFTRLESALDAIRSEQERYTTKLWEEYELTYAASKELAYPEVTEETRSANVTKQNKLRSRIRELGAVNVGAIDEYVEVKERFDFLSKQYKDLTDARSELNSVIKSLETDMKDRFEQVFAAINENFRLVFAELFGGGTAELSLSDPENVLESGIEIAVAPPGKIIKSLSLLSGGEQVFVAIALFFAILRVNPAPFCLLDEIEAALDEVNVARFAAYAKDYSDKTQFIIITHRRGTMEEADTMYGVTMGERGISKVLPLHLNEVEAKTGLKV